MSEGKQTFTDTHTGEEVESTWLARGLAFAIGMFPRGRWAKGIYGLVIGVSLISAPLAWINFKPSEWPYPFSPFTGWYVAGGVLLIGMLVFGLLGAWASFFRLATLLSPHIQQTHDLIAQWQHRHRLLRSQEHHDVPDGALSRAQPPGDPQATDAALSIADDPDEPGRLIVSIEEDIQVVVDDRP